MGIKFRVRITQNAENDVTAIRTHIAQHNRWAAEKWVLTVERLVRSLRTLPERYEVVPEAEEISPDYRSVSFGNYRLIYRVAADQVIVERVIHAARLLRRAWFEPEPPPEGESPP
jgi:plasmid stabilization system protein ParE